MTITEQTQQCLNKLLELPETQGISPEKLLEICVELVYDKFYKEPDLI